MNLSNSQICQSMNQRVFGIGLDIITITITITIITITTTIG
jgi:hypothetical protein